MSAYNPKRTSRLAAGLVTQRGLATCARHVSIWWTRVIDYKRLISAYGTKRTSAVEFQCLLSVIKRTCRLDWEMSARREHLVPPSRGPIAILIVGVTDAYEGGCIIGCAMLDSRSPPCSPKSSCCDWRPNCVLRESRPKYHGSYRCPLTNFPKS